MPPKIIKRWWPKGAEVTVIGLPSQKKSNLGTKKGITCFSKLKPFEKEIYFGMSCETVGCIQCSECLWLVEATDITANAKRLSDCIQDEARIDIKMIEILQWSSMDGNVKLDWEKEKMEVDL